jgi:uncharacterized protein YqhQ
MRPVEPSPGSSAPPDSAEKRSLSTELALGGQAVIEGVMMRSPHRVAVAVRTPAGSIALLSYAYTPITRRIKLLGLPIIRGAVGLVESLRIGIQALNWSAEQAVEREQDANSQAAKWKEKAAFALSLLLALALGLGLFLYLPLWLGKMASAGVESGSGRQVAINLVVGGVRILLLLAYLWAISQWKDIRRVFQYHGSEHKSIFAFEVGSDLTAETALRHTRFHPRCGTSFLLIVALAAVIFFSMVDSAVAAFFGEYPSVLARFAVHLLLLPLLAGLSYEFLRYSAKHTDNRIVKALIQPGLWLQRITTQEPDLSMCEVAVTALKTALEEEDKSGPGEGVTAEEALPAS